MGESINCNVCGAAATVHLTQILNNKIQKVDLCEGCAQSKGVMDPAGFALGDLLGFKEPKIKLALSKKELEISCPRCQFTIHDFKQRGRVGCGDCYESLASAVAPALKELHAGLKHRGKMPNNQPITVKTLQKKVKGLERVLELAIQEERFEEAAVHRDHIEEMKRQMQTMGLVKAKVKL